METNLLRVAARSECKHKIYYMLRFHARQVRYIHTKAKHAFYVEVCISRECIIANEIRSYGSIGLLTEQEVAELLYLLKTEFGYLYAFLDRMDAFFKKNKGGLFCATKKTSK